MSNLVDYAKDELKRIGMIDSGEPYNDWGAKAILDLIGLFASQGHSGFTAPYVAGMFHRLAMLKPASPLTGEDDEWVEVGDGSGSFQNKRYSAVFKDKDGTAYNIDGRAFTDDGETWYTCSDSRVNVTFPYAVPDNPEYVYRNKEDDYVPRAARFLNDLEELCIKYDISISHEDCQGAFILEPYNEKDIEWLRDAKREEGVL